MFRKLEDNYYIPFKEMLGKSKEKKKNILFSVYKTISFNNRKKYKCSYWIPLRYTFTTQ